MAGRADWRVPLVVAGAVATVVAIVALLLFEPWRLFTSSEVDESSPVSGDVATYSDPDGGTEGTEGAEGTGATGDPEATEIPQDVELTRGTFETAEHTTTGEAAVLLLADGRRFVRLEDLATSDGPDLRVWLSDQPSGGAWGSYDDGRSIPLGELTATHGNQNYEIPESAGSLEGMITVVIWCDRFNVAFGTAPIEIPAGH